MRSLLPFLIVGLASGSLYGLAALGLVLTYRTTGVFNFAHGAVAAAAAFVFSTLHGARGLPWPIAGAITVALFGLVGGLLLDRVTCGLGDAPQVVAIVLTVGLFLGIQGVLYLQYGNATRPFRPFLPQSGFHLVGVLVSWEQVISATIALAAAAGLYGFLRVSRLGVSMRGVVDNPTLVSLAGQRPTRIRATSWVIGSSFAAISGILLAPTLGLDVNLLTLLVVQAFGAAAVGTFSSLPLTYFGGLVIGVLASLGTRYLTDQPWSGLAPSTPFVVLIAVLLAVPVAKLPKPRFSLGSIIAEPTPMSRRRGAAGAAVAIGLLCLVPSVVGTNLPVWINALTYVVLFGSLALLVWTSGQISLCHLAFACLGATTMGHLTHAGVPWLVALGLTGLIVAPVGALIAIPAIRLSGIYLALVTLGFGILMQDVVFGSSLMFGTTPSITSSRPVLGVVDGTDDRWLYFIYLAIAATTCGVLIAIARGRLGLILRALSQSPTMLVTHGLSTNLSRLIVFAVSAFFAAIGGAMMITQYGAVSGVSYGPVSSILLLAVLAVCGTRLLRSAILAAALLTLVPGYVQGFSVDRQTLVFGLAAIAASVGLVYRPALATWAARRSAETVDRARHSPVTARMVPPARPVPADAPAVVGGAR